jgi:hypothetical protein
MAAWSWRLPYGDTDWLIARSDVDQPGCYDEGDHHENQTQFKYGQSALMAGRGSVQPAGLPAWPAALHRIQDTGSLPCLCGCDQLHRRPDGLARHVGGGPDHHRAAFRHRGPEVFYYRNLSQVKIDPTENAGPLQGKLSDMRHQSG